LKRKRTLHRGDLVGAARSAWLAALDQQAILGDLNVVGGPGST
jgi:hypothetical protein